MILPLYQAQELVLFAEEGNIVERLNAFQQIGIPAGEDQRQKR